MKKVELLGVEDEICRLVDTYNTELGKSSLIKVEIVENNIIFYINNNKVLECVDPTPITNGGFGMFLHTSGSKDSYGNWYQNSVSYDNLIVRGRYKSNKFNLPFPYTNRENPTHEEFAYNFWKRMTASFDHNKLGNRFQPFTTETYIKKDCPNGVYGITCYDSHNGTDFSANKIQGDYDVLPVADGEVVYVSDTSKSGKCMISKNSYGCVVIIKHSANNLYTLYAHLSEIYTKAGNNVKYTDIIGKMGNTGCGPKCGVHLHLGTLIDKTPNTDFNSLTTLDWDELLVQSEPNQSVKNDDPPKHYCTYKTSDGNILSFQDPSGWSNDSTIDRWALPSNEGGCSTDSPYLWMRDIGISKPQTEFGQFFLEL